jgi:acyl carrier protein
MTKEKTFKHLKKIMFDLCECEDVTGKSTFYDDLGLDSLDVVEIIMEVEKRFEILIPDEDILDWDLTVGQFVEVIESALLKTSL